MYCKSPDWFILLLTDLLIHKTMGLKVLFMMKARIVFICLYLHVGISRERQPWRSEHTFLDILTIMTPFVWKQKLKFHVCAQQIRSQERILLCIWKKENQNNVKKNKNVIVFLQNEESKKKFKV